MTQQTAGSPAAGVAVLGIDPGRRWTAGVLRVGAEAVVGWTLGPVGADGVPDPAAVDDVDDVAAWGRYMRRVLDAIEDTIERHGGPVHLACEVIVPPRGRKIAMADWLIPRQLLAGLISYDPAVLLVRADGHGKARPLTECYPPSLWPAKGRTGGRPAHWGPNEARRAERDHERAAYDIAGAGARMLARRAVSPAVPPAVPAEAGGAPGAV